MLKKQAATGKPWTIPVVLREDKGDVAIVKIRRPKALNALNNTLLRELMDALLAFDADPGIGTMVITGSERAFAAGADIKEMAEATAVEMLMWDNIAQFGRQPAAHGCRDRAGNCH